MRYDLILALTTIGILTSPCLIDAWHIREFKQRTNTGRRIYKHDTGL